MTEERNTAQEGRSPCIFVSFDRGDADLLADFLAALKDRYFTWCVGEDAGRSDGDADARLRACPVFLFAATDLSLGAEERKEELYYARKSGKKIVIVLPGEIADAPDWFRGRYADLPTCRLDDYESAEAAVKALASLCPDVLNADRTASEAGKKVIGRDDPEPGDTVSFGSYPIKENRREPIDWIVIAKENGRALLLSKRALDLRQYHLFWEDVTWETCALRRWLNNTFLFTVFDPEQRARLLPEKVRAEENPEYEVGAGRDVVDPAFIPGAEEAARWFPDDSSRRCKLAAFAAAQDAEKEEDAFCRWWLRTPGELLHNAVFVDAEGRIRTKGMSVSGVQGAVRPALWVKTGE